MNITQTEQDAALLKAAEAHRAAAEAARAATREYRAHLQCSKDTTAVLEAKRDAACKLAADTLQELLVLSGGILNHEWVTLL